MPINLERLKSFRPQSIIHEYTCKDVMLYALGLGLGSDPTDANQLKFVYEDGLVALPTIGGILGYPGFWPKEHPELGITWQHLLNGEQGIEIFKPLPTSGNVTGILSIDEVVDKGPGKFAILYTSREVRDTRGGDLLCKVTNTVVCRADGGFGGQPSTTRTVPRIPAREPDVKLEHHTLPQAGLIYRLSGDFNPLHADPAVARTGGFPRPILHGAATWGIAGYALLQAFCGDQPDRFQSFNARFTSPVFPGETIQTQAWTTGSGNVAFRARVPARDVTVLDNGSFTFKE